MTVCPQDTTSFGVNFFHEENKWHNNVLKSPFNSFPLSLLIHGKSHAFYQFTSLKVVSAATAIRAAWSTVSNWRYWYNFLDKSSFKDPSLSMSSLHYDFFSSELWDAPPFAVNLHFFSLGIVNNNTLDLSSVIKTVKSDFFSTSSPFYHSPKIQKLLTPPIKNHLFPDNCLDTLSYKASLQKNLISPKEINSILKSLARQPFIISATFHKVLCNALCTTTRIKNHPTLTCFACGKARDDLFHFLRCPCVAFIFDLPPAFGSLHANYFSTATLAKNSVLFEAYYIVTRQYGKAFLKSPFTFIANKTSNIARHVAIKNRIMHLTRSRCISYAQVHDFMNLRKNPAHFFPNILDVARL